MSDTQTGSRTSGVLAATCISTLVVNANTSAVSILLPAISHTLPTSATRDDPGLSGREER
jgi:hypothetical protein